MQVWEDHQLCTGRESPFSSTSVSPEANSRDSQLPVRVRIPRLPFYSQLRSCLQPLLAYPRPLMGTISELEQISTSIPSHCTVGKTGQEQRQTWRGRWGTGPKSVLRSLPPRLLASKLISSLISPAQMPAPSETQLSVPATLGQGTFKKYSLRLSAEGLTRAVLPKKETVCNHRLQGEAVSSLVTLLRLSWLQD